MIQILNFYDKLNDFYSFQKLKCNYSKTSISEHLLILNNLRSDGAIFAGNAPLYCEHLSILNMNTSFPVPLATITSLM